jgi:hypothetical protein
MGFDPHKITHLRASNNWLGPLDSVNIAQRGEVIVDVASRFMHTM